ncbi:MAG: glutamate racemase [Candidatus Omnitrophota bacterium]
MSYVNRPIGVFDSGAGGLTSVRQLIKFLPNEDIIYLGDTARVPYGNKSKDTIIKFSVQNALYLFKFKVKLIVIACNTSSSLALPQLKRYFQIPIIGVIEPGVKKALEITKNSRIGVIGTNATIESNAYQDKIKRQNPSIKVFTKSCPLFVPLAEEGWLNDKVTFEVIQRYLKPLKKQKIDTLILGCTHYPLLKTSIARAMGPGINLVDSAREVALNCKRLMQQKAICANAKRKGRVRFYLTDQPHNFKKLAQQFLGQRIDCVYRAKVD